MKRLSIVLLVFFALVSTSFARSYHGKISFKNLQVFNSGVLIFTCGECEVNFATEDRSTGPLKFYQINTGKQIIDITWNDNVVLVGERYSTPKRVSNTSK